MAEKYKLTEETKTYYGVTLYRIQALVNIDVYGVKAGDLGGWIEKESNLSQEGICWVSGNARVYDDACLSGGAKTQKKKEDIPVGTQLEFEFMEN